MFNAHGPGPAPAAHARASAIPATWSSWRVEPQVNERRNVPRGDGAATRGPGTCPGAAGRIAAVGRAARGAEVEVGVEQLAEQEPLGQAGGKDQASISDGVVVVEGDGELVGAVG